MAFHGTMIGRRGTMIGRLAEHPIGAVWSYPTHFIPHFLSSSLFPSDNSRNIWRRRRPLLAKDNVAAQTFVYLPTGRPAFHEERGKIQPLTLPKNLMMPDCFPCTTTLSPMVTVSLFPFCCFPEPVCSRLIDSADTAPLRLTLICRYANLIILNSYRKMHRSAPLSGRRADPSESL